MVMSIVGIFKKAFLATIFYLIALVSPPIAIGAAFLFLAILTAYERDELLLLIRSKVEK
jgi:hypothetical protein